MKKALLLVGGGHSHLAALPWLQRAEPAHLRVTLVAPSEKLLYSGMMPGWIAGQYCFQDCVINLRHACLKARVELIVDEINEIDFPKRVAYGLRGKYQFDIISLNVGSSGLFGGGDVDALIQIPAKPFSGFVQSWARWRERILSTKLPRQLLVVGGGAAGVELAFALAAFARSAPALAGSVVTLATQEASVLNDMDPAIQERVSRSLRERGVIIFPKLHFLGTETDVARFSGGKAMKTDLVIVATGSRPFPWLAESARRGGISLGANQALLIEKNLKVRGAFGVFAAGDCAEISGEPLPRSGVHALRQGDVLGRNLLAMSRNPQSSLSSYRGRRHTLAILNRCDGSGIAIWGRWSFSGKAAWHLKNLIDTRFVARFNALGG